ncbi:MAG TPA: MATE family efflux transporter [Halomicronema sp.]
MSKILTEAKACLRLAIPLAAAQLAQAATNFADTVMMGLLGSTTIAGGGLGSVIYSTLVLIITGLVSSTSILASVAFGMGDKDRIRRITNQGLLLAIFISFPLMILIANFGNILGLLGQDPDNIRLAENYLSPIMWGFPASIGLAVLRSILSSLNHAKIITIIVVIGVVFNICGNYILMFGKLGFPALGLAGIAWASTLTYWLMLFAAIFYMLSQRELKSYHFFKKIFQVEIPILADLIHTGLPIGGLFAFEAGLFATTAFLMGYLGTIPLAAHQIALQTAAMTFMVPVGISLATTVRVGQMIGQNDPKAARLAGFVPIAIGASFMTAMAVVFWLFPKQIVSLYLDIKNPENYAVVNYAISLLGVAAMFQIFDGIQAIAGGALRGLKDTQIPMLVGIFSYWGVGFVTGCILCFYFKWGGLGLWAGLALGLAFTAIILTWRFTRLIKQILLS